MSSNLKEETKKPEYLYKISMRDETASSASSRDPFPCVP
jgi:hypothetical protein